MIPDYYHDFSWFTGSGERINFKKIYEIVLERVDSGCRIFIGSDSFVTNNKVRFSTALCLHGDNLGSRYFFYNEKESINHYKSLVSRITEETHRSVKLAEFLINEAEEKILPEFIELHLDVSPFQNKNATSKFSEMLKGYVGAYGIECRLKPDAWASQSVADKHSK